ncbi:MAG: hypothetical protein N3H32_03790 [Nitrososphaeria archaeon]|nr:hypothetical protein [Nitrososphaeria archaeon]MDW8043820.1 hypothetical protein [Nitrososphaerota archaeon]
MTAEVPWTLSRDPTPVCNPLCRFFRCMKFVAPGKPALDFRRNPPWCHWVDGPCIGFKCVYASCAQLKLLPEGRCALFVKPKEETRPFEAAEEIPEIRLNLRGRAGKRIKDLGF